MTAKIDWYREVLELEPNSKVFFPLARMVAEKGEREEAISLLEQGLLRHPEYMEARLFRIELLHQAGRREECNIEVGKLSKMFANYAGFWQAWAACLASEQDGSDTASLIRFLAVNFISGPLQFNEVINRGLDAVLKERNPAAIPPPEIAAHAPVQESVQKSAPEPEFAPVQEMMPETVEAAGVQPSEVEASVAIEPELPDVSEALENSVAELAGTYLEAEEVKVEDEELPAEADFDAANVEDAPESAAVLASEAGGLEGAGQFMGHVSEMLEDLDSELESGEPAMAVPQEPEFAEAMPEEMAGATVQEMDSEIEMAGLETAAQLAEPGPAAFSEPAQEAPESGAMLASDAEIGIEEPAHITSNEPAAAVSYELPDPATLSSEARELAEDLDNLFDSVEPQQAMATSVADFEAGLSDAETEAENASAETASELEESFSVAAEAVPMEPEAGVELDAEAAAVVGSVEAVPGSALEPEPEVELFDSISAEAGAPLPDMEVAESTEAGEAMPENMTVEQPPAAKPASHRTAAQAEAELVEGLDLPDMEGANSELPIEAEEPEEEQFSLRTRSMAEVLAEQGDIQGALDIYEELAAAATSGDEVEDINRRMATLRGRLTLANASSNFNAVEEASVARNKEKLIEMLEALAQRVEARAQ